MSIENAAPDTGAAQPTSAELQNTIAQNGADGAGVDASSDAQPGDAQDTGDSTPEHRKASYRFSEMSKQIRDLQLQLAKREGLIEALRANTPQPGTQAAAQNAPTPAPVAPEPTPPNPADFAEGQYDPRFLEALAEYKAEVKIKQVLDARAQQSAEAEQKEAERRAFEQGQQRFFAVLDAAEKAGATGATQVLEIVGRDRQTADLLLNTTHPLETADWLADNQEWLSAITRERDPVKKALLVGRVDQHIASHLRPKGAQSSAQSATPAQTTQAAPGPQSSGPAPTTVAQPTVRTAGTGGAPFNPASASFEQYEAWRRANPNA